MPNEQTEKNHSYRFLQACGVYYYVWIVLLPRLGRYEVVEEIEELEGGARLARLVRKYPNSAPSRQPSVDPDRRSRSSNDGTGYGTNTNSGGDRDALKRRSREEQEPLLS